MKKYMYSAIAASALAAASQAQAQSQVTMYGIIDAGIQYVNHVPVSGGGSGTLFQQNSGNLQGSRWGLQGKEDLGGGYSAIFTLENGFAVNTGTTAQNGRLFGRQAFVGLASPYGSLTFGRQQNALFQLAARYDPLVFGTLYSAFNSDAAFTGRADNTVKYTGSYSGLTYSAFYSSGFDSTINDGAQVPSHSKVGREYGGGIVYSQGPVGLGVVYDQQQGTSITTQDDTTRRLLIGANYAFMQTKLFVAWRILQSRIGVAEMHSNLYWAGLTQRITPSFTMAAAVYHTDLRGTGKNPTSYVLEGDYFLSKRTDLYLEGSYVQNRDGSNLGVDGVGSNIVPGANQLGVIAGLRHRF
jgi:predicted porin